jgi:hypothetical protein
MAGCRGTLPQLRRPVGEAGAMRHDGGPGGGGAA